MTHFASYALAMIARRLALPRTAWGMLALPALLLGACAPAQQTQQAPLTATTAATQISFYPSQAGLNWTYLPDGDTVGGAPYTLKALGPAVFGSVQAQTFALTGRGADQTSYRLISAQGVQLIGFRKPGLSVQLDPPWLERPAEGAWKIGLSWQGESGIKVQSDDGRTNVSGKVSYSYRVLDQRTVSIAGQSYKVWVINRQITDTVGGLFPASQEEWFTPYVGDVRTAEGLLLTGRNFAGSQP